MSFEKVPMRIDNIQAYNNLNDALKTLYAAKCVTRAQYIRIKGKIDRLHLEREKFIDRQ